MTGKSIERELVMQKTTTTTQMTQNAVSPVSVFILAKLVTEFKNVISRKLITKKTIQQLMKKEMMCK